jgi:NACHT domain
MSTVQRPRKARQRPAAGPMRLRFQWLLARIYGPLVRAFRARRTHKGRTGPSASRAWRHRRLQVTLARSVIYVGAAVFLLGVARAVYVVVTSDPGAAPVNLDSACADTDFSCEALAGTLLPIFSLVLASAVFLLWRHARVHRPFVRRARDRPREVVQTAGSIIGEIVGRDELCNVIIDDLRDRGARRPHVVIGGVGTGKTALLVRLTKLLAERGAVPVPVRLRDAQERLDFRELARLRFLAEADAVLLSDAEGEKVWRQLCKDDRIVVLADGLEEALIEGEFEKERDTLVRLAVRQANDTRLPLIIASRPHDPLRVLDATVVELEPLSEEAALQFIQQREVGDDEHRLDWIVETADVAETPLYLQITRQLRRLGLLEYVTHRPAGERLDTRSVDRAELRYRLLATWMEALVNGHFPVGLALNKEERQVAVEQLSALACIGLKQDSLYVRFDDLKGDLQGLPEHEPQPAAAAAAREPGEPAYPPLIDALRHALQDHRRPRRVDIRLAATFGMRLGLVETRGDGVRFPHSIMQAYLGSRLIDRAMADPTYRREALKAPGRELLIALVTHSRAVLKAARPAESTEVLVDTETGRRPLRDLLSEIAGGSDDVKALDLYAAALEIDSIDTAPAHRAIATVIAQQWPRFWSRDQRTLEEAKLNLVRRLGEAAGAMAERARRHPPATDAAGRGPGPADAAQPAYFQLYCIGRSEPSYSVRLAAAQEIGAGGDQAFAALEDRLGPELAERRPALPRGGREQLEQWWRECVTRAWLAPLLAGSVIDRGDDARDNLQRWLDFVADQDARVRKGGLSLSLEVALAQGFKHSANRRRHAHAEARAYLAEQARDMLRHTRFWFTRLTLVHALCLWALPDEPASPQPTAPRRPDHKAMIENWLASPDGQAEHPFVFEARRLALWALHTGQPERFIWIDESGISSRVGSQPATAGSRRKHNLWIPPSTGWTALHQRAQQLVADVLLLLNLAERGDPIERERRLRMTHSNRLPPCLAGDRSPLDASRAIGMARPSEPGSNCKDGCPFGLCPYPPRGERSYRVELSEAFCRRQQALLTGPGVGRRAAPWQGALPGDLKRFWKEMAQRAQPAQHEHELDPDRSRGRTQRARPRPLAGRPGRRSV